MNAIKSGKDLRAYRQSIGLSQAKLAEITGVPKFTLSAFELEKLEASDVLINAIQTALLTKDLGQVITRKKRYQTHQYTTAQRLEERIEKCLISPRSGEYLKALEKLCAPTQKRFSGLSLFAGCGGFSLGFSSAGYEIKGFVEIDDGLSQIYQKNFPKVPRFGSDISNISNEAIRSFKDLCGGIDVIIGGPPCQGFSLAGKRSVDDPRNRLFKDYLRFIDILKPKFAIMENVRLLTSMKTPEGTHVKDSILEGFAELGYKAQMYEVNAMQYGIPQSRERVFFIAVREDLATQPSLPKPTHSDSTDLFSNLSPPRSFADACSDLDYLESGEKSETDHLHAAVKHPDHVIEWLWDVSEGCSAHENLDPKLRPPSGYNTTYKRQVWKQPAGTVQTTFGMISGCRNVHPVATRALTIREAARLQSFPDDFKFVGSQGTIRTGIGNAVPPLLALAVAQHIRSQLSDFVKVTGF